MDKTQETSITYLYSILTIIFTISKVFQVGICADWRWWLVLSPMLIIIALQVLSVILQSWIKHLEAKVKQAKVRESSNIA